MKKQGAAKGFTLTEIMLVLLILGFLAGMAVPNFVQARLNSRRNACINNLRIIQSAKDQYAVENGQPDSVTPTTADLSPYFKSAQLNNGLPTEPMGGTYTPGAVSALPTCSNSASPNSHALT
ncbi:MAG: prepilin-type N-terminal cleavage/methylation domain-containing protein [Candidatus Omnitrophica bacterium]|nr:prepilin-type N-terminal cleavage/methylation domain-containing protein [Candidatus Omnitrophota bacterium]